MLHGRSTRSNGAFQLTLYFTPPAWAGLFFCLASAEVAGLLFCSAAMQPYTSVYSAFCVVHAVLYHPLHKTMHKALQVLFLRFAPFCLRKYQTGASGYNTACTTLECTHVPGRPAPDTRYHRHAGRCTGQRSRPIIIMYIRAHGCSRSQTMPARRRSRCFPRPAACDLAPVSSQSAPAGTIHPAGQSSNRGAARNHQRRSRFPFRAFAR